MNIHHIANFNFKKLFDEKPWFRARYFTVQKGKTVIHNPRWIFNPSGFLDRHNLFDIDHLMASELRTYLYLDKIVDAGEENILHLRTSDGEEKKFNVQLHTHYEGPLKGVTAMEGSHEFYVFTDPYWKSTQRIIEAFNKDKEKALELPFLLGEC